MAENVRVGAVGYLNAKPLYDGLEDLAPEVRLTLDYPSRLAVQLARGELDVALIPSIEYARGASLGYKILPEVSISSSGPVRSVKLFSRVPFDRIDRLALDAGSRTSQALARIWLDRVHKTRPSRIEDLPLGVPAQESTADAILVIGDRAMKVLDADFLATVDMAEAWKALTGLPFVFAFWVARENAELGDLPAVLIRCRDQNLARARELAETHGPRLGLDVNVCYDYLTKSLQYHFEGREQAATRLFFQEASRLGLAPEGVDLVFPRPRHLAQGR